jgi:hypothetical protein
MTTGKSTVEIEWMPSTSSFYFPRILVNMAI